MSGSDLILMDLKNARDGRFRGNPANAAEKESANIPIIALTAHARPEVEEECRAAAGINGFLAKPAIIHQLYTTIERHLHIFDSSPAKEQTS
jgi:CheY-like chemotaxis protein